MIKNKIVAQFMGIKTVEHNHWCYGDVTAIVHEGIIDLPLLVYEPDKDYNHLHEAWVKFRDLKFEVKFEEILHVNHVSHISKAIVFRTITEAFNELVNGIEWYNSIVQRE